MWSSNTMEHYLATNWKEILAYYNTDRPQTLDTEAEVIPLI